MGGTKMKHRQMLSVLLAVVMLIIGTIGLLPVAAEAIEPPTVTDGAFEIDTTGEIKEYTGSDSVVIIPTTIGGITVTAIGEWAFHEPEAQAPLLQSVVIPEGVTRIETLAFGYCRNLTSVTLPDTLQTIADRAFLQCVSLTGVIIPASVTSIGDYAFSGLIHDGLKTSLRLAVFLGNAPDLGTAVFGAHAPDFKVYRRTGATGYDASDWSGYDTVAFDEQLPSTLTYQANGGTGNVPAAVQANELGMVAVAPCPETLSRQGYRFSGWNVDSDGGGHAYVPGNPLLLGVGDVTLYAQWNRLYPIESAALSHGTIVSDKAEAVPGEVFTLTITPDEGWNLLPGSLAFHDLQTGEPIDSSDYALPPLSVKSKRSPEATAFSLMLPFEMPEAGIRVSASFIEGDYRYEKTSDGTIKILSYVGQGGNVLIPRTIEGREVTNIGSFSFWANGDVYGVLVPDTVTTIGEGAFADCMGLRQILFAGPAPALEGVEQFPGHNTSLRILFIDGNDGFTVPTWQGFPSMAVTPAAIVAEEVVTITFAPGEDAGAVRHDVALPDKGYVFGSDVSWQSSHPETVSETGEVNRPAYGQGNKTVTLTATVSNNGANETRTFGLTVPAYLQGEAPVPTPTPAPSTPKTGEPTAAPTVVPTPPVVVATSLPTAFGTVLVTGTTEVTGVMNSTGALSATISGTQLAAAMRQVTQAAGNAPDGAARQLEILVSGTAGIRQVGATMPTAAIAQMANDGADALRLSTPLATLTFDKAVLATLAKGTGGDIHIAVSTVEPDTLSAGTRAALAGRPVYDFQITSGGQVLSALDGQVSISVPYLLADGEDADAVIVHFINDAGELETVRNGRYDAETGTVRFSTDHFSLYTVGYNKVTFVDVPQAMWYAGPVGYLAARGIVEGVGSDAFCPEAVMTRAQFLVMAMRAYGLEPEAAPESNFSDAGNTWYSPYIATAKRKGLAVGVGNNRFAPDKELTRQEMCVLLYNLLGRLDMMPRESGGEPISAFSDADRVASWAGEAMSTLVKAGLVHGDSYGLRPEKTASRAQAAQILFNSLSK